MHSLSGGDALTKYWVNLHTWHAHCRCTLCSYHNNSRCLSAGGQISCAIFHLWFSTISLVPYHEIIARLVTLMIWKLFGKLTPLQGNLTFQTSNPNHAYNKEKQRMFTKQLNSTLNLTDLVANMEDFSYFGHYTYWVHTVSHCRSVFKLSMQVFRPTPEAHRIACFIVRRHSWVKLHVSS